MTAFNFHHHFHGTSGIYNLNLEETPKDSMFSAGIHPNAILQDNEEQISWLKNVASHKNCVAIGECGLDSLASANDEMQKKMFVKQIHLANELKKPLIIHCVRKYHELASYIQTAEVPMVIHGYNKRKTIGANLLKKGFYLSFGSSLLHNVNLQAFFKYVPVAQFFLETDAAETDINEIYLKAAEIKNIPVENIKNHIQENLHRIGIII